MVFAFKKLIAGGETDTSTLLLHLMVKRMEHI